MRADERPSEPEVSRETAKLVREAVRAERERMAKLLHETTCQDLTGGYLMASATAMQCQRIAPELESKLVNIAEKLLRAGEGLRKIVHSLQSEEQQEETIPDP